MKTVISNYQAALILIFTLVATAIVFLPSLIINQARQDAWISIILLIIIFIFISLIYNALANRMGRIDLINFTRKVFGNILTIPIGITIILGFIILSGTVVRETSEVMLTAYMPLTPLWFFNITIILASSYIVFHGLEVIGRSVEILFYIFLFFFLIFILLLIPEMSFEFIQPLLGQGIRPIWDGMYPGLVFFGELFIILILAPHLTQKGQAFKPLLIALIIGGGLFLIVIFSILMLFGPAFANELKIPLITAFGYIQQFRIIERLDSLFIFMWIGGGVLKNAIFIYVIVYTVQKLFNLSTYHIFIPLVIPPVFYISFYFFANTAELTDFLYQRIPYFLVLQILYPVLLLAVSWLRGINCNE